MEIVSDPLLYYSEYVVHSSERIGGSRLSNVPVSCNLPWITLRDGGSFCSYDGF